MTKHFTCVSLHQWNPPRCFCGLLVCLSSLASCHHHCHRSHSQSLRSGASAWSPRRYHCHWLEPEKNQSNALRPDSNAEKLLEDRKHFKVCLWDATLHSNCWEGLRDRVSVFKNNHISSPLTLLLELLLLGSMKMSSISRCFSSSSILRRCSSGMMLSHSRMGFSSKSGALSSMLEKLATCTNTQRGEKRVKELKEMEAWHWYDMISDHFQKGVSWDTIMQE